MISFLGGRGFFGVHVDLYIRYKKRGVTRKEIIKGKKKGGTRKNNIYKGGRGQLKERGRWDRRKKSYTHMANCKL